MGAAEGFGQDELASLDELVSSLSEATRRVAGSDEALSALLAETYDELRRLAGSYLRRERADHTLQPTALVHEAYLRLSTQHSVEWKDRAHLLAIAARMMRRVLMRHAEERRAQKRGANAPRLTLDAALDVFDKREISLESLHLALSELERLNPRQAQIVELRFFGGLTTDETAEVLDVSSKTVKRQWAVAKLWLQRELSRDDVRG